MTELLTMLAIVVSDLGAAASHMAYRTSRIEVEGVVATKTIWVPPSRLPFYDRPLPLFRDVWHLVAGLRYVGLTALAVVVFQWDWRWYLLTAFINGGGWMVLKILHGKSKQWGLIPAWMKGWF